MDRLLLVFRSLLSPVYSIVIYVINSWSLRLVGMISSQFSLTMFVDVMLK